MVQGPARGGDRTVCCRRVRDFPRVPPLAPQNSEAEQKKTPKGYGEHEKLH